MGSIISISIDCSQIDKSKLKDGKYLNFTVSKRKEVGKYGDTHALTYNQSKDERDAKVPKVYLKGTAKEYEFKDSNTPASNTSNEPRKSWNEAERHINNAIPNDQDIDDLPF